MTKPRHSPPHIYLDNTWYMITARVYKGQHLLYPAGHKELVRDHLKRLVMEFNLKLSAWVILDNHYHLLVKSRASDTLVTFFRRFHGRTSYELNNLDQTRGRQIWHNFWDTGIRDEGGFWRRVNYIHHNPVKHGYTQDSRDWPFSSYPYYLEHKGEEWLSDLWQRYTVVDFTEMGDQPG
jgi:putative transposase